MACSHHSFSTAFGESKDNSELFGLLAIVVGPAIAACLFVLNHAEESTESFQR